MCWSKADQNGPLRLGEVGPGETAPKCYLLGRRERAGVNPTKQISNNSKGLHTNPAAVSKLIRHEKIMTVATLSSTKPNHRVNITKPVLMSVGVKSVLDDTRCCWPILDI